MKRKVWLVIVLPIALASFACTTDLGGSIKERAGDTIENLLERAINEVGLPLPDNVSNVEIEDGQVLFQVEASVVEVITFFRVAASSQELTERTESTVTDNQTYANLIFEGSESGRAIVVQMAAMDEDTTAVSLRLEELQAP